MNEINSDYILLCYVYDEVKYTIKNTDWSEPR